jgi:hypothetical protein
MTISFFLLKNEIEYGGPSCSQSPLGFYHRLIDGLGLEKLNLNDSQLNAVADCVSVMDNNYSSIKLLWSPPGTGKTKTISSILWALLIKGQRALACAPTNTAVLEIANRIVKLVVESSEGCIFLNNIVLFGNKKKMMTVIFQRFILALELSACYHALGHAQVGWIACAHLYFFWRIL